MSGVFNIAKGRVVEYYNRVEQSDPTDAVLVLVYLQATSEADATLEDYDDLGALLAGSNTEATFTNWVRIVLDQTDLASLPAPDDTNNRFEVTFPSQTISSAGGATNNTIDKVIVCYDPDSTGGADSALIPLVHLDVSATTNGGDLKLTLDTLGFFRAA